MTKKLGREKREKNKIQGLEVGITRDTEEREGRHV